MVPNNTNDTSSAATPLALPQIADCGASSLPLLTAADVEWVVNDIAELGVKIGNQFFFLYKGGSLVYSDAQHDDGSPMHWRPVFKREFGECAHPINHEDYSKIGTVSLADSDEWEALPSSAGVPL